MDLHTIATAFAGGHDTMFLLKLRNVTDDLAQGGDGEIYTVVSLRRGGLCLELLDTVLTPVYGEDAEVVFMYPLSSVEALAKHVIGDKAVELMQESEDDIVDTKGTGDGECPEG